MPYDLSNTLVIGVSTRSLFDLEKENAIFETDGLPAYRDYQLAHEDKPPAKGTAFHLVEGLLKLNRHAPPDGPPLVEVVLMSRNDAGIGFRLLKAAKDYGVRIERAAFTSGASLAPYLEAFSVDLFLSRYPQDVRKALTAGVAAASIYAPPADFEPEQELRIAFDGDAVIFDDVSEQVYQKSQLAGFQAHEREHIDEALGEGPFAQFLKALVKLKRSLPEGDKAMRLALVTARNDLAPIERVVRTLRSWDVSIDESFFLGGLPKDKVLKGFRPHIFFDDQAVHLDAASRLVPSGHVLSRAEERPNGESQAETREGEG